MNGSPMDQRCFLALQECGIVSAKIQEQDSAGDELNYSVDADPTHTWLYPVTSLRYLQHHFVMISEVMNSKLRSMP